MFGLTGRCEIWESAPRDFINTFRSPTKLSATQLKSTAGGFLNRHTIISLIKLIQVKG